MRKAKWVTFKQKPEIHGVELTLLRESFDLSQEEFGRLCGWSQQNQNRLEGLEGHEVHVKVVEAIQKAVKETKRTER